jgi:hypothetical protein
VTKEVKMIKIKTNKQQLVIRMLLVISTTMTVTTMTTQQAFAKNGNSRGQTDASHDTQALNDSGVPSQVQASGQRTSP